MAEQSQGQSEEDRPEQGLPTSGTAGVAGARGAPQPIGRPYQALYRRYRPQRFADVRGQDHVTRALRNAVREERVAHAYLFSGPRGTGKTSTARILAMALNCESPQGGEPDGVCLSCAAVRSGASMDVFELDAASNRKLDEMRDLLSRVALGTPGRWKVYIIDEVHQLTPDAASALLKTLEEPPSHVVFVLATTDPQRVLPTILSRTQHFEFHLLDGDLLTGLLTEINEDAGLGLPPEAVRAAVQRGRGSARDAESALEQLAAAGDSQDDTAPVAALAEALSERDVGQALVAVAKAVASGREPRRLGNDLVEYLRNAFLAHQAPALVLLPGAATAKLAEQAQQMGLAFLVRCMETVGQALVEMRDSVDPRVTLEAALIRLASPAADLSPAALLERVERLERAMAQKGPGASASPPGERGPLPGAAPPTAARPGGALGPTTDLAAPSQAPATGPAQAKAALGAFLRGSSGAAAPPVQAPQAMPEESSGAPAGTAPAGATPAGPAPAAPSPAATPHSGPPSATPPPTRDELTKAWGDSVFGMLSRRAQVYLANGRFIGASGGPAQFALPDRGAVERAASFVPEAEDALAAHFGRRVTLRLVVDDGTVAAKPGSATSSGDDETYDLDDLDHFTDAPPPVPVEQRIMEAFPGSVLEA